MKTEFKHDLGAAVKTPQGDGHIVMAAVTKTGLEYLIHLDAGRSWFPEAQVRGFTEEPLHLQQQQQQQPPVKGKVGAGLLAFLVALASLLFGGEQAKAQPPMTGYVSAQDLSSSTNWSEVVFPGTGDRRIILKSFDVQSDSATNELWLLSGTRSIPISYSLNNTQLVCQSGCTNVITNQFAIVQMTGATNAFVVNILYTNQATNIFVGGPGSVLPALSVAAGLGSITNTNGVLWLCTNRFKIWQGVGLLSRQGEALFSAQVRAPMALRAGSGSGPAGGVSNQVRNATVFYRENP